jgi:hypothetical protein
MRQRDGFHEPAMQKTESHWLWNSSKGAEHVESCVWQSKTTEVGHSHEVDVRVHCRQASVAKDSSMHCSVEGKLAMYCSKLKGHGARTG